MADEPQGVDFRPNGTIVLTVDGTRHTLRRPNFGELRRLWEGWDDRAAEQDDLADKLRAAEEQAEKDDTSDGRRELKKIRRELRNGRFDIWVPWLRDVFDTLSDQKLPDEDDKLDAGMLTAGFAAQVVAHFQAIPKASG